jgi:hypothetical protein
MHGLKTRAISVHVEFTFTRYLSATSTTEGDLMTKKHWVLVAAMSAALASSVVLVARAEEKDEGDEQKIKLTDAPQAAQDAINKESKGAKVETVDKEMRDGKPVYEADAMIDGKNHEIVVDADGKVLSNKLDEEEGEDKEKGEKHEKDEQKISLDQVPEAVKATFAKESDGAELKDVEKETKENRTAYEAKANIKGDEYEIKIAEDGKLIKKELKDKEHEKGKKHKDEDEEKEEHEQK